MSQVQKMFSFIYFFFLIFNFSFKFTHNSLFFSRIPYIDHPTIQRPYHFFSSFAKMGKNMENIKNQQNNNPKTNTYPFDRLKMVWWISITQRQIVVYWSPTVSIAFSSTTGKLLLLNFEIFNSNILTYWIFGFDVCVFIFFLFFLPLFSSAISDYYFRSAGAAALSFNYMHSTMDSLTEMVRNELWFQ